MKRLPEAISCYQKAIKLDSRFEAAFINLKIAIDTIIASDREGTLEETFMVSTWHSGTGLSNGCSNFESNTNRYSNFFDTNAITAQKSQTDS